MVPRRGIDGSGPRFLENGAKVTYEAIKGREGMEAKSVSMVCTNQVRARPEMGGDQRRNRLGI
jgi:hypothetical protein